MSLEMFPMDEEIQKNQALTALKNAQMCVENIKEKFYEMGYLLEFDPTISQINLSEHINALSRIDRSLIPEKLSQVIDEQMALLEVLQAELRRTETSQDWILTDLFLSIVGPNDQAETEKAIRFLNNKKDVIKALSPYFYINGKTAERSLLTCFIQEGFGDRIKKYGLSDHIRGPVYG